MRMRRSSVLPIALLLSCEGDPAAVTAPTWADVEPLLRVECNHCHGATARLNGASESSIYRLDFYEMNDAVCGEAAQAIASPLMARGWAPLIKTAITPHPKADRARMPPAPAAPLAPWVRETLLRWADDPRKGLPHGFNRRPRVDVFDVQFPSASDSRLRFTLVVEDGDGEPVIGVLKIGDRVLKMDRAGAFSGTLDTGGWPTGAYRVSAVLCDGWDSVTYDLGTMNLRRP